MRIRKDSGFSLLEIIIVLAISGGIMVMYTHYARNKAENIAQQNVADALAEEMKGVLNFIDDDTIALLEPENQQEMDNPLYSNEKSEYGDYHFRITNEINDTDTGSVDNYYLWGNKNNKANQQRYLFLSEKCKTSLKSKFAFEKEYLPCFMRNVATNSSAVIERIGFAGGRDDSDRKNDINRMDVIVRFKKEEKNSDYHFADYAPHFAEAFSKSGFAVSHAMIVHRANTSSNWQLVMNKQDKTTPVELSSIASNLDALEQYTKDEFGVRFTIDTNDNSSNSGNAGGKMCWSRGDSGVKLCYDDDVGTGSHGEDTVMSLTMTDPNSTRNSDQMGTLESNIVMENTGTRVAIFKRKSGWLQFDENNNPIPLTDTWRNNETIVSEYTLNDQRINTWDPAVDTERPLGALDYPSQLYDAYELVTPPVVDFAGPVSDGTNLDHNADGTEIPDSEKPPAYQKYSDFAYGTDADRPDPIESNKNGFRYPVQICPKVEQELTLIDGDGAPVLDDEGKPRKYKYVRQLYPRIMVTISSLAAYAPGEGGQSAVGFSVQDRTREGLSDTNGAELGQFGGLAVQVEFAEQDTTAGGGFGQDGATTKGGHYIQYNSKYVWIISTTMGMYHAATGTGMNVFNPNTVSYSVTRWCSTVSQNDTPADLLDTQQYD